MKSIFLILISFSFFLCRAQVIDSLAKIDTAAKLDSLQIVPARDTISRDSVIKDSLYRLEQAMVLKRIDSSVYNSNPFYRFVNPTKMIVTTRKWAGKEEFFYAIVALLLFFALLKNAFSRYLDDLFRVFFRTTLKMRQTRDQLINAPLPSLLYNILYTLSAALFITLMLQHFGLGKQYEFWMLFLYCIAGLIVIYAVKFVMLKLCGWMLRASEATDTYIFIVFTTNKVMGILLLPFIIGLAFMKGEAYQAVFFLSICLMGMLFLYRFYLSYVSVQKQIKINFFHFMLYLLAFEIAPLLLINKLLFRFF